MLEGQMSLALPPTVEDNYPKGDQHSFVHCFSKITLFFLAICCAYIACCTVATAQRTEEVVIAPIDDGDEVITSAMTREELEDQLRRFADRFYSRVWQAANNIRDQSTTPELEQLMQRWKRLSLAAVVEIAIGPNAVTNLFDMLVMTTLSRMLVEDYWVPEKIGDAIGQDLITAYRRLEGDIWKIADDVLTGDQQDELRALINEWREMNPDEVYPWYVRLSEFSGQRAARLNSLKESGGLLKEVAKAREAAEELQHFGERVLFYLHRAPAITGSELEKTVSEVLGGGEMSLVLEDTDRFVDAVEKLVDVMDRLPNDRLAAIDQLMEGISEERQDLLRHLSDAGPGINETLHELRQAIESVERIVANLNQGEDTPSEPLDIGEYQALAAEAGKTATELRLLAQTLGEPLEMNSVLITVIDKLGAERAALLNQVFWLAAVLILIFFGVLFGALLLYRYLASRLLPVGSIFVA